MVETWVTLYCSSCEKEWERGARAIPAPDEPFTCPDCGARRSLAEFLLTQRDLQTVKKLREGEGAP